MPNLVTELFSSTSSDYFNFDQLEILCIILHISANSDINAEEIGRKTTDSAEKKKTFKEKPFHIRRYRRVLLNKSQIRFFSVLFYGSFHS
jgi:hypothetical protein